MERKEGRKSTGWIKNSRAERNLKFVWEKQGLEVWDGLVLVSSLSTTQQSSGRSLKKKKQVMSPETAAKQNLLLELKPLRVSVLCSVPCMPSSQAIEVQCIVNTVYSQHILCGHSNA